MTSMISHIKKEDICGLNFNQQVSILKALDLEINDIVFLEGIKCLWGETQFCRIIKSEDQTQIFFRQITGPGIYPFSIFLKGYKKIGYFKSCIQKTCKEQDGCINCPLCYLDCVVKKAVRFHDTAAKKEFENKPIKDQIEKFDDDMIRSMIFMKCDRIDEELLDKKLKEVEYDK